MMNFRNILFILFLLLIAVAGCSTPNKMYYYGNYSKTLYHQQKEMNDASVLKHKQELQKIISESEKKNLPVPPGIYAELGFIFLKQDDSKEAVRLFKAESELYPESKLLMERLIQNAEANSNKITDSTPLSSN